MATDTHSLLCTTAIDGTSSTLCIGGNASISGRISSAHAVRFLGIAILLILIPRELHDYEVADASQNPKLDDSHASSGSVHPEWGESSSTVMSRDQRLRVAIGRVHDFRS